MSLYSVDDVLSDIEREQNLYTATAKKASAKMNASQKTVIKELIVEANLPKNRLEMDAPTKLLYLITGTAIAAILNRLTNTTEGGEGLKNYLLPEYASDYACRLVDLMKGSQAILFLEDCLKYGVYQAIRNWDINPYEAEASLYQNTPTTYIMHFIAK